MGGTGKAVPTAVYVLKFPNFRVYTNYYKTQYSIILSHFKQSNSVILSFLSFPL